MYRIINASYIRDYSVYIEFDDGVKGVADLSDRVGRGGVFTALKDINTFRKMRLDPKLHTITWENGADLAPEFLRERIKQ